MRLKRFCSSRKYSLWFVSLQLIQITIQYDLRLNRLKMSLIRNVGLGNRHVHCKIREHMITKFLTTTLKAETDIIHAFQCNRIACNIYSYSDCNVIIWFGVYASYRFSVSQLCATEAFYTHIHTHSYIICVYVFFFLLSFVGDTRARRSECTPRVKRNVSFLFFIIIVVIIIIFSFLFFLRQQVHPTDPHAIR